MPRKMRRREMVTAELRARVREACSERTNYRIVVEPPEPHATRYPARQEQCAAIAQLIRSYIGGMKQVYVTSERVCKFCGYGWETHADGVPGCCDAAMAESDRLWQEAQDAPTDE